MRRALALALVVACGAPPASAPHNAVGPAPPPPPPSPTAPWLAQLDDPRAQDRALDELARLGDPSAIAPIGEAWLRDGRPLRMLEVMIGLAQPRAWDRALPYLARAVRELDADDPRSVDAAIKAADALGEARLGLDALAEAAQRASDKRTISAQIAAIRALGQLAGDPAHAVVPLVALLGRDAPPHPRTATDAAQRRTFELDYELYLASSGAAINAIASLRTSLAIEPLVLGLYRTPELFAQLRRALIASGPAAERALAATVRGDNAAVEQLFRDRHLDTYCGDRGDAPAGSCQRVSAKLFYASAVLGDFRDPASVHDLVGVLAQPDYPAYYDDDQPSEVTARHAALDALRRIGAPEAAEPVRALWANPRADVTARALALAAYPFVARDDRAVPAIAAIVADDRADEALREEAATALARLAHDPASIALFERLRARYGDAAARKAREAERHRAAADAADRAFQAVRARFDQAKATIAALHDDPSKTDADRTAALAAARKAEADLRDATRIHRDKVAPFKNADSAARAYVAFQRRFAGYIARVDLAARCKADAACYAAALVATPDAACARIASSIPDLAAWSQGDKAQLAADAIDRAALELGKLGRAASAHSDALLAAATTDDRPDVRAAALLALPHVAALPCQRCAARLDAAVHAGQTDPALAPIVLETGYVRDYFVWAGR